MEKVVNKDSLVLKYFILPLYGITFNTIQEEYIKSYISKDGLKLFLHLTTLSPTIEQAMVYAGNITIKNLEFSVLHSLDRFEEDLKRIVEGEYSQLSEVAIQRIIAISGLEYNKVSNDGKSRITSSLLLALKRHSEYKKYMETKLGVDLTGSELISKLSKQAFIESIINQEL